MRIVYLAPHAVLGGAERSLLDLMTAIRRRQPDWHLRLLAFADGPLIERARQAGIAAGVLPLPHTLTGPWSAADMWSGLWRHGRSAPAAVRAAWRFRRQLAAVLAAWRPDIVHTNGMRAHIFGRLACPRRARLVWHMRDFVSGHRARIAVLKHLVGGVHEVMAVSQAVADDVRCMHPDAPTSVVLNGIDLEEFQPGPADVARLDAIAGLSPADAGTLRVGHLGSYVRWKGQDVFLRAAARFCRQHPQQSVRFYVIGGPLHSPHTGQFDADELRGLADGAGMGHAVGFVPFQRDPAWGYRSLDLIVHSSTQPEPFGRVIAEAMACGRAVIGTQTGGASELFTHGRDAIGVPPGDVDALAAAMADLLQDPSQMDQLGAAALETARARFDRHRLAADVTTRYAALRSA